jgi:uncharacterized protein
MEFKISELERDPIAFDLRFKPGAIDFGEEAEQSGQLVPCARCVEPVTIPLASEFDLIFRPVGADAGAPERSITAPETEIGYYQKDSLLLEDVLREQVLLSLPVRTLCKPDCKGLCPRCGQNRNSQACSCDEGPGDPRWEALAELRGRIKS